METGTDFYNCGVFVKSTAYNLSVWPMNKFLSILSTRYAFVSTMTNKSAQPKCNCHISIICLKHDSKTCGSVVTRPNTVKNLSLHILLGNSISISVNCVPVTSDRMDVCRKILCMCLYSTPVRRTSE